MEQGGDSMQLYKWMQLYGGCSSSKETYERLKSMSDGIVISKLEPEIPTRYVEQSILDEAMELIGRLKDPLFRWLCTKFPEEKVEEAYRKLGDHSVSGSAGNRDAVLVHRRGATHPP